MSEFEISVDKDDNLIITCETSDFDIMDLIDELYDREIEWYTSAIDGWSYLYDAGYDRVYWIDDHMFNKFHDLRELHEIVLPPRENSYENYAGYEWNYEREWTQEERDGSVY
jgi:hypothetical protein